MIRSACARPRTLPEFDRFPKHRPVPPRPTTLPEMPPHEPPRREACWTQAQYRGTAFQVRVVVADGRRWVETIQGACRFRVREGAENLRRESQAAGEHAIGGVRVFGATRARQRAHLRGVFEMLPPGPRSLLKELYLAPDLGQSLDFNTGAPVRGGRILGLADDRSVLLDSDLLADPREVQKVLLHELGHLLDSRLPGGRYSNQAPWGQGPWVSQYAAANPQEDFAETHRVVGMEWDRLVRLGPEGWAREPLADKKLAILRLYGIQPARHAPAYQGYLVSA